MSAPRLASPLDRLLRPFADVRAGEAATALLLAANVFLLLSSYYVAKVLREPLILAGGGTGLGGAQLKSYTATASALLLAAAVPAYGALAGRVPRRRLVNLVTGVFLACFAAFFALARAGLPVGVPFFVFVSVFNVMIVAQFWAFANDVYTEDEGRRLFPIVGVGASAGGVAGSALAGRLIEPLGLDGLFLVAAAILFAAAALTNVVDARERRRTEAARPDALTSGFLPAATGQVRAPSGLFQAATEEHRRQSGQFRTVKRDPAEALADAARDEGRSTGGAFQLVFRNRYLLLIGLMVMLLNWVNTNGEFILSDTVTRLAQAAAGGPGSPAGRELIGRFYSSYLTGVNVAVLLIQSFLVSRALRHLGVHGSILVLPVIALGGYALLAFVPVLPAIRWAKTLENATDYSLNNTVRHTLFLPTTREEKYKAKQATDAFFQRAGDVLSSLTVFAGAALLGLGARPLAVLNLSLVVVWLALAVAVGRRYRRLAAALAG